MQDFFNERKKLFETLSRIVLPKQIAVIYGPRQVGKTTLLQSYLQEQEKSGKRIKSISADRYADAQRFFTRDKASLINELSDCDILAIDEAQHLEEIDLVLKNLVDYSPNPNLCIIVTGSSSIGISDLVTETNAGRKAVMHILPLAQFELTDTQDKIDEQLHTILVYGSYPKVLLQSKTEEQKIENLNEILDAYLFKDIFAFDRIKKSDKITALARLVAYRIGSELNIEDLAKELRLNRATIEKYLDLMEKCFILFKHEAFSSNQSNVIKKSKKYYFYDLGIRNAIIGNYKPFLVRDEKERGALWENWVIAERRKYLTYYEAHLVRSYFWRVQQTYGNQEIDLIEQRNGGLNQDLSAYEIKTQDLTLKPPSQWVKSFPASTYSVINSNNYASFILPSNATKL